jgi:acyl-[acyl carrier protein]--UDP-N-acetylglucosamine O-acyltransferase
MEVIAEDYRMQVFDAAVIAVSTSIEFRAKVFTQLMLAGIEIPSLIHKTASIDKSAQIGRGNVVLPFVHIGPYAKVEDNNFISSYVNIEHHCVVADNNTFGPSVVFSGSVVVGSNNRFGTGIHIEPRISIGDDCIIASGTVLTKNLSSGYVIKNINSSKLKARND